MSSLEKQCSKCKQVLPVELFFRDKGKKDGRRNQCKKCEAPRKKQWWENGGAEKNRQRKKQAYKNGGKEKAQSYVKANPVQRITNNIVCSARHRAANKNLPFDIDLDYIRSMVGENAELASHCPVFNIPLDWSCMRNNGGKPLPNSPSLDRIDPERGYVKGNVWIISHRANTIKNDATHEELKLVTKAVGEAIVNSLEF